MISRRSWIWIYYAIFSVYVNAFHIYTPKSFIFSAHLSSNTDISTLNSVPDNFVKVKKRPIVKSTITSGGSKSKRLREQGYQRNQEIINPNKLRILGGIAKGKKIESPDVYLRPMMAKVREALFSSLTFLGLFDSETVRVLDIFSGSGSVGLEALSRGAGHATFVDFSENCISTALKNGENLGFATRVRGVCGKAEDVLQNPTSFSLLEPYQLVTLTPPYEEVIYKELIKYLIESSLVTDDTIVVIEYPVEMNTLPHIIDDKLYGLRNRRYGRTILATYVYKPTKSYDMRPDEFLDIKKR